MAPDAILTRCGARPGDRLFASGPVGSGTAFACAAPMRDTNGGAVEVPFRPVGRLREGRCLGGIASACMDTSDVPIATLDELMRLNGVGVSWERALSEALHPAALSTARGAGLPPWTMLAPLALGQVTAEPGFRCRDGTEWLAFDTGRIRNLFADVNGDPARYLRELLGPAAPTRVDPSTGRVWASAAASE